MIMELAWRELTDMFHCKLDQDWPLRILQSFNCGFPSLRNTTYLLCKKKVYKHKWRKTTQYL